MKKITLGPMGRILHADATLKTVSLFNVSRLPRKGIENNCIINELNTNQLILANRARQTSQC